ncbi:craniofacial development protein 2-like [Diabrotica virgifera virgifera]|uniref:Craniofacial development protein 2-like n=1 Tax=Diabrotica virgifera virgifera TaxID=50390 RepID=A0ABM5JIB2_DIAVI|nr:craniofacial development protein 2-like [Diabrotica virgifera virgifera]
MGSWNIRTMLASGKMQEIALEMKKYQLEILAVQEIRWKKEGKIEKKNFSMYYSGENKQGTNGTAFMVNKKMREKLIQFKAVNERISYIRK